MSQRPFINFASPIEITMSPDHLLHHQNSDTLLARLSGNPESDLAPQENHSETAATNWDWLAEYANGSNSTPQVWSPSRDPQEPSGSFQDYYQFQMDHNFAATEGAYTSSKPGEQAFWDLSSANTSNSVMTSQTYPPYLFSPGHQQVHNAIIDPQQIGRDNVMLLTTETYDSANESFRSYYSSSTRSSPSIKMEYPFPNIELTRSQATMMDDISDEDGSSSLEPYAQLIYRALKSVAGHAMVLKEIYEWFEENTDKAKDPSSKGWQNSIRHNLSMNGAFRKVEKLSPTDETKKGYIWVLEESALVEGVKSTTRYRKHNPNRKGWKGETPAPLRQRSGAKGGKATRKSAKMRRSSRMYEPNPFRLEEDTPAGFNSTSMIESHARRIVDTSFSSDSMPYYLQMPTPPVEQLLPEDHHYSYPSMATYASTSPDGGLLYETPENCDDSILTVNSFYDPNDVFLKNEPGNMS